MASQKSWIAMKICDTLLPNGMACHHHMENRIIINCKGQKYFQLANKLRLIHQINDMNHDVKLMSQIVKSCDY
jgi:hypothetical protein